VRTKIEHTGQFIATDDSGNRYAVHEYTEFLDTGTVHGPGAWTPTLRSYELDAHNPVNANEDGSFELARDGTRLRRL